MRILKPNMKYEGIIKITINSSLFCKKFSYTHSLFFVESVRLFPWEDGQIPHVLFKRKKP